MASIDSLHAALSRCSLCVPRLLECVRVFFVCMLLAPSTLLAQNANSGEPWVLVGSADDSDAVARHETVAVIGDGKLYLIGGRGLKSVDRYDPDTNVWENLSPTPIELHHTQPVFFGGKFYVVTGFTCCYPREESLAQVLEYDPSDDTWAMTTEIPEDRRRGAAGAVLHEGKIIIVGGNTAGHDEGAVSWVDRFDPVTGIWEVLPDAPTARDHYSAVLVGNEIVATGGRQTAFPDRFANLVEYTDIYNFETSTWRTVAAPMPTPRAGAMAVPYGSEVILIGGEISDNALALSDVEALDLETDQWRSLQSLQQRRHGGGAGIIGSHLYVIAGSKKRGGGVQNELTALEVLDLDPVEPPPPDTDADGLTDADELALYNTDPDDNDTDDDGLKDGEEISLGTSPIEEDSDLDQLNDGDEINKHQTDPLDSDSDDDLLLDGLEVNVYLSNPRWLDSDQDGLNDGVEVNDHQTNPTLADTDGDDIDDLEELSLGTDPLLRDTDGDGLADGEELNSNTDPLLMDSDADGLGDGDEIDAGTNPLLSDTDADGLDDGAEVVAGTDPLLTDTDGDGLADSAELLEHLTNPLLADTDDDGASDSLELEKGYNPLLSDTDGDGINDGDEIELENQPSVPAGGGGSGGIWLLLMLCICRFQRRETV